MCINSPHPQLVYGYYVHVLINSLLIYYSKYFYNYYFGDLKEDKMPILAAFA